MQRTRKHGGLIGANVLVKGGTEPIWLPLRRRESELHVRKGYIERTSTRVESERPRLAKPKEIRVVKDLLIAN